MPSQTRSSVLVLEDSAIAALRDSLMASMREELDRLRAEMRNNGRYTNGGTVVRLNNEGQRAMQFSKVTKIEFPKFGREDVRGWMFRCEQFFTIDNITDEGKINLISIHLHDISRMWHRQFMRIIGNNVTWPMYREAILQRFGLAYDDPLAKIKKLKQTGTVQQYIDAYDRLLYRVELQEEQTMSFFTAGLQSDIELAVRMFKPKSLAELYGLCKLQESQLQLSKLKGKMPLLPTPRYNYTNHGVVNSPKPVALPTPNASWRNKSSTSNSNPFRKQLTQKELEEKRAKNLCFYCDQTYTPCYKCSIQVLLLDQEVGNNSGNELEECLDEEIVWEQEAVATG
ncbi:hypothetical protein Tco_0236561 [Tanacetum coccineum]